MGSLRPFSLTYDLRKWLQGAVAQLAFEDMSEYIDPCQCGSVKDSSAAHNLVSLRVQIQSGIGDLKKI